MFETVLQSPLFYFVLLIVGFFIIEKFVVNEAKREKDKKARARLEKNKAYRESVRVLDKAKESSINILKSSTKQASKTMREAQLLSDETKKLLDSSLDTLTSKQKKEISEATKVLIEKNKELIEKSQDESSRDMRNLTRRLEEELLSEIEAFKNNLHQEVIESEHIVEERVHSEYEALKGELARFKKQRLASIDREIAEIVERVGKEVLGKSISTRDHEDLIIKALEQAKQDRVIS